MKTWADFYPFVLPEVSGCALPTVDHHLRLAARDFCQRTGCWHEWADAITADGLTNRFDYDMSATQQELVRIERAVRNDCDKLDVRDERGGLPGDWATGDTDRRYAMDTLVHFDACQFAVFPKPCASDTIRVEMVFKPSMAATQVPDVLVNSYADEVSKGAKKTLLGMRAREWTDLVQAGRYAGEFESAIHRVANRAWSRTERGRLNPTRGDMR